MTPDPLVIWHDVECGSYTADLGLWLALAREAGGPVLDVGAGTGRVALTLAGAGIDVCALDREPALLAALAARARAADVEVPTVVADAQDFDLGRAFALVLVPMQTVQLLGDRAAFLRAARRHLRPDGRLAVAVAGRLEDFGGADAELVAPDVGAIDGWRFASQPTAVRVGPAAARIERRRRSVSPAGTVADEEDVIELAHVPVDRLEAEGRAAGFAVEPARSVAPTAEHVGSEVVVLRA